MSSDSSELQFSIGALTRSRDRGRPLGLATVTGSELGGVSVPAALLLARGVTEYVAPAPSSSTAAQAPVTKYVAPTLDVTYAASAPFTDLCRYFVAPAPVIEYIAPARVYQELIVAGETTQNIVAPVQYAAPTMTKTGVGVNRDGTPDVLNQPQFGLAPHGFAAPVQYGGPVNKGTTTVTGVDMNRDGIPDILPLPQSGLAPQGVAAPAQYGAPVNMGTTVTGADMNRDGSPDVLQQPQFGIAYKVFAAPVQYGAPVNTRRPASGPITEFIPPAPGGDAAPVTEQPHHPRQGDLTMMALLIAVGDEIYDRGEDPELGELVGPAAGS